MRKTGPPRHIAFIMDGNGRWAGRHFLARIRGHERGAEVLREVTEFCARERIAEVTYFALSTENYRRRPAREIQSLMRLLEKFLVRERRALMENGLRFKVIGRIDEFPEAVRAELARTLALTAENRGMVMRLALNYGSRREIVDAVRHIAEEIASGARAAASFAALDEGEFGRYLYDPDMTDPDLLIRTAGEFRISNFLLWQLSYSELYITDVTWPEFTVEHLREAIAVYRGRERKFGSLETLATAAPRKGVE